jgi:hypothetical protein
MRIAAVLEALIFRFADAPDHRIMPTAAEDKRAVFHD